ncbi:MAG TPA: hypothetical protein VKD28_18995 [Gemmatimonadales bacterium]|nr:hypothetical protein [Gemmatimonadales bacterium]
MADLARFGDTEFILDSYKQILLQMIGKVLAGDWSVSRFREEYCPFFLDAVPTDALSDTDEGFFAAVQEKLDWTTEDPNDDERQLGWLDHADFIQWLRTELELHRDYSD